MPWSTSDRRSRLPVNWPTLRRATKQRAHGHCQAAAHHPDCNGIGTECDHITPGDDHRLTNLQWLSKPCHRAKSLREAAAAKPSRQRTPERHPGLL